MLRHRSLCVHPGFTIGLFAHKTNLMLSLLLSLLPLSLLPLSVGSNRVLAEETNTILVLGDSLSAAYGIPTEQGWVSLLQKQLDERKSPYQIINASISGETTDGGLRALPALLQRHQPDIVLLELGANDGLRGFPLSTIETNLTKLIQLAHKSDAQVLLIGMRIPPNYGARYAEGFFQLYPKLAQQYQTALLPFLLDGIAIHSELMQDDRLHPKAKAQSLIKDRVLHALESLLKMKEES